MIVITRPAVLGINTLHPPPDPERAVLGDVATELDIVTVDFTAQSRPSVIESNIMRRRLGSLSKSPTAPQYQHAYHAR